VTSAILILKVDVKKINVAMATLGYLHFSSKKLNGKVGSIDSF
jgi:hypothetical protein